MPKKVTLKVQPRTGFDKSFQNMLTMKCGTLVPLLCDEVIPNTTVSLRAAISASLPPLASDAFMRVQLRTEAFFVPFRLLDGSFQYWQTQQNLSGNDQSPYIPSMPSGVNINAMGVKYWKPGSLADYLGMKFTSDAPTTYPTSGRFSLLPFIAYHRIYDDWYRNPLIEPPLFWPRPGSSARGNGFIEHFPYECHLYGSRDFSVSTARSQMTWDQYHGGLNVFDLRQRNFDDDLFTTAKPSPQLGVAQSVGFTTDQSGNGSFTIADLRAANSIQQYLERNNILGYRYSDYVKGQYGADLKDGVSQRVLYLGSASFDVYSKGIYQSNNVDNPASTSNPFVTVGAAYGSAHAGGDFGLIKNFTANESGYIFVMASLVPKVTYGSGVAPHFLRYVSSGDDRGDMANPILQNIGNEPLKIEQIAAPDSQTAGNVFGYTDRYANFMTRQDEVHGLLRDGESLESFALQRNFNVEQGSDVAIGKEFIEISTAYLDQVAASTGTISQFGCWVDSWLDYKVIQPLARYSIPSLQNPAVEHGDNVVVTEGGSRI